MSEFWGLPTNDSSSFCILAFSKRISIRLCSLLSFSTRKFNKYSYNTSKPRSLGFFFYFYIQVLSAWDSSSRQTAEDLYYFSYRSSISILHSIEHLTFSKNLDMNYYFFPSDHFLVLDFHIFKTTLKNFVFSTFFDQ